MRFSDFITIENYPFGKQEEFSKLIKRFLLSTTLKPFTEAVLRHKEVSILIKKQIDPLLIKYWEALISTPEYQSFQAVMKLFPEDQKPENSIIKNTMKEFIRHPSCVAIEREIKAIVVTEGLTCLTQEQQHASSNMLSAINESGYIPDVHEYFSFCLEICGTFKCEANVSIQQMIGHLSFIRDFIQPFRISIFYSEHRKQAEKLEEIINAFLQKIKKSEDILLERNAEVEIHEARVSELEDAYLISTSQPREPLPGHSHIGCLCNETEEEYKMLMVSLMGRLVLEAELRASQSIFSNYLEIFKVDNDSNLNDETKPLKACLNYWNENIGRIRKRRDTLIALTSFVQTNGETTCIYRNVSQGELDSLRKLGHFTQYEKSLEREKWFYSKGANPGSGVEHDFICEIHLYPGAYQLLQSLCENDGNYAAIVQKVAEPNCFGIHEDALPLFNRMIKSIFVRNRKDKKSSEIKVNTQYPDTNFNYLIDFGAFIFREPSYLNPSRSISVDKHQAFKHGKYVKQSYFESVGKFMFSANFPAKTGSEEFEIAKSKEILSESILELTPEEFVKQWEENELNKAIQDSLLDDNSKNQLAVDLKEQAIRYGYICENVLGDGNCFFHAMLVQLKKCDGKYQNLTIEELRAKAIQHILDKMELYNEALGNEADDFIIKNSQNGEWADHIIIQALSRALNLSIIIIQGDDKKPPRIFRRAEPETTIYLGYEVGWHYQSLNRDTSLIAEINIEELIMKTEVDSFAEQFEMSYGNPKNTGM